MVLRPLTTPDDSDSESSNHRARRRLDAPSASSSDDSDESDSHSEERFTFRAQAVIRDETTGAYSLASVADSKQALNWVIAARTRQLQLHGLAVDSQLTPVMYKSALDELRKDFARSPANRPTKRAHTDSNGRAALSNKDLKSNFKAMCHMVFGDQMVVASILVNGQHGPDEMAVLTKRIQELREQRRHLPKSQQALAKQHQSNRKWRNTIINTLKRRGVDMESASGSSSQCSSCQRATWLTCKRCARSVCTSCSRHPHYVTLHIAQTCLVSLCMSCPPCFRGPYIVTLCAHGCRGGHCLNTGTCRNAAQLGPGSSKGSSSKGSSHSWCGHSSGRRCSGKGWGKSTEELLDELPQLNMAIDSYVKESACGKYADGTWAHGSQSSKSVAWRMREPSEPTCCIAPGCSWAQGLLRCDHCHARICTWHCSWAGGRCHCTSSDGPGCQKRARQMLGRHVWHTVS
jgi:hypothetical protein